MKYYLVLVLNATGEEFERAVSELREVLEMDSANTRVRYFLTESIRALV